MPKTKRPSHRPYASNLVKPQNEPACKQSQSGCRPSLSSGLAVLALFLIPRLTSALTSPVLDCDEVFNYWEASHFLLHKYGFQTWEYSPVFGIRSWTYAVLHAALVYPRIIFAGAIENKSIEFHLTRTVLGIICAICETRLYQALYAAVNPRVAVLFMLIMATSTGMFHAAVAFLPSSFAMYAAMLGAAEFITDPSSRSTSRVIICFAVGALIGWPFAGALLVPFVAVQALASILHRSLLIFVQRVLYAGFMCLLICLCQTAIDSFFYGRLLNVPWNILAYNVFSDSSRGPDIFGTEPWHYYLRNLALNFNIWLALALLAGPVLALHHYAMGKPTFKSSTLHTLTILTPFYLWLFVFTAQPHKEERFMYPVYPFLAINASFSLHAIVRWAGRDSKTSMIGRVPASVRLIAITVLLSSALVISILRSASLATGYSAPLKVYAPLSTLAQTGDVVCLGKEWYRFPSSYFLPSGVKARFVKSAFTGLQPGRFGESVDNPSLVAATRSIPSGMNDQNLEDASKYIDISNCTYLVDSYFPSAASREPSQEEPDYVLDDKVWNQIICKRFLDADGTSLLGRLFWTPDWTSIPPSFQRQWGKYCLLERKQ